MSDEETAVALFPTCLLNEFYPHVGESVVRVLERRGFRVLVPAGLTCCGQPAYNAGFFRDARKVARHTIRILEREDVPVVVPSGSCADMIVHQYPELFRRVETLASRARSLAARTFELTQFLGTRAPAKGRARASRSSKVAYHPSCHLSRGLGVKEEPRLLLGAIEDLQLVPLADEEECCGFGGLFAVKEAAISGAMLEKKLRCLEASGADCVTSCDLGCLMQIGGGLHRRGLVMRARHVAELIDDADRSGGPAA